MKTINAPEPIQVGDAVTVVIPAYNLASYLPAAIQSVQRQDYSGPIFIIVVDDGSSDGTHDVALEMARHWPALSVFTQSNLGRVRTRNRLLDLAATELVAWLDGDDMAHPSWIREQLTFMAERPSHVAVGGHGYAMTSHCRAIGPLIHPLTSEEIDQRHLGGQPNAFFQSCVLTRKSSLQQAGGYREKYPAGEDYDLWLRLAEIGRLANVDRYHLFYRVHGQSANWTIHEEQRRQGWAIVNEARVRRRLPAIQEPPALIPESKKDDWNQRVYWINITLRSGNPRSAIEMIRPALARHPGSLLLWIFAAVACGDMLLFAGNRTGDFRPGEAPRIRSLPTVSFYRLGRWLYRAYRGR